MLKDWLQCHQISSVISFTHKAQYNSTAIKLFNVRSLYGDGIWIDKIGEAFDSNFLKFLGFIYGIPNCVVGVALQAELRRPSLATQVWLKAFPLKTEI